MLTAKIRLRGGAVRSEFGCIFRNCRERGSKSPRKLRNPFRSIRGRCHQPPKLVKEKQERPFLDCPRFPRQLIVPPQALVALPPPQPPTQATSHAVRICLGKTVAGYRLSARRNTNSFGHEFSIRSAATSNVAATAAAKRIVRLNLLIRLS
jgi:hypothetical protein